MQRTTFASEDARALPLYVRAGMQPMWVSLYVQGPSSALPAAPPSFRTESATSDRLAALERDWTGHGRSDDHGFWATIPDVDAFVVREAGAPVAFGYARTRQALPMRVVDRLVIHPDGEPVGSTLAALARAGRGGPVHLTLFGPHPVLPGKIVNGRQALFDPRELGRIDVELLPIAAQCPRGLVDADARGLEQRHDLGERGIMRRMGIELRDQRAKPRRKRIVAGAKSETPTITPNCDLSLC